MAFERLDVRLKTGVAHYGATVSVIGTGALPTTWVTVRAAKVEEAGLGARVDVLIGRDEDAGKLRLVAAERGVISSKKIKNSTAYNLGYVAAIGPRRQPKRHCHARVIAPGTLEIDVGPPADAPDGPAIEAAEPDHPAPPCVTAPKKIARAGGLQTIETINGVTLDFSMDNETVRFNGLAIEITTRQAELLRLLARPRPAPVAVSFLVDRLFGKSRPRASELLTELCNDTASGLKAIGLDLRLVKGAGYQLRDL